MDILYSPKDFENSQLSVLSPNAHWLARFENGQFQILHTATGYPILEDLIFESSALSIEFSRDSKSVYIVLSNGKFITIPFIFDWRKKPDWLDFIGEALTGMTLTDLGEFQRLSLNEHKKYLDSFIRTLENDKTNNMVTQYLISRFDYRNNQ